MESKFDWLTITIKPENPSVTFDDCFHLLGDRLMLTDLFAKMEPVGRFAFYDWCIAYENITLCCPFYDKFAEQGICLRMSSQGLDFFTRYLQTYNITLKQWLAEWRALCFEGYITKEPRIDYAMDDIRFNGDEPILTLKKVEDCLRKGEMTKKSRVIDILDGSTSIKRRYKVVCKETVLGRTVYVGSRESEVCCRIYDKYAEQLQKKEALPKDCTSWTRCEFEFKGSKAMSVLNAFLDFDDADFGKYMLGVTNNYLSFVVRNNDNVSRCPIKRWWKKFLNGCTEKFKLPHKKPARSALSRAERGLSQYVPTVFTMFRVLGLEGVYRFFESKADEMIIKKGCAEKIFKTELANNIYDDIRDYEEMNGFKNYQYNSFDGEEGWSIEDNMREQHFYYLQARYKVRCGDFDKDAHSKFMDGQEVIS